MMNQLDYGMATPIFIKKFPILFLHETYEIALTSRGNMFKRKLEGYLNKIP
jgi:hypothetical protein